MPKLSISMHTQTHTHETRRHDTTTHPYIPITPNYAKLFNGPATSATAYAAAAVRNTTLAHI